MSDPERDSLTLPLSRGVKNRPAAARGSGMWSGPRSCIPVFRELGISIEGEGTSGKKHLCGGHVVLRAYCKAGGWG